MQTVSSDDHKAELARRLASIDPCPAGRFAGRGIVVCAGGAKIFTSAYVLLSILRRTLGCLLPVEVWHFGRREMSSGMKMLVAELGADTVDAEAVLASHPAAIHDGWQLKPYALMWSRFADVLLLDADQVPVRDPSPLFDWPAYAETGAVFWPDVVDLDECNPAWAICGLAPERCPSLDSGQVLVDKRRHWAALQVTLHLNERAETYYRMIYGDKDTFLLGWRLAKAGHIVVPHRPFEDQRCLYQRDLEGRPLFQHRTRAKWSYAGSQEAIPGFVHDAACRASIAQLRERWNGFIFDAPARTALARRVESRLASTRLRIIVPGEDEIAVDLLACGEFGAGRSPDRQNWYVTEVESSLRLVFHDGTRETWILKSAGEGRWIGRRLVLGESEATAVASGTHASSMVSRTLADDFLEASGLPAIPPGEAGPGLVDALRLLDRIEPGVAALLRARAAKRSQEFG